MEQYVTGFMRVLRKIDSADHITQLAIDIELHSRSELSARNELRVLDFPEEDELNANRAAQSPGQLTAPGFNLLRTRYWLDTSDDELWARAVVAEALASASSGSWDETNSRLYAARGPLYRLHESEREWR
ncbi:hypothetical protein PG991_008414 [Apiospora marii]|uniref:Uncharacterized protein n=1 Tax=Apiospora marii TaxID=335849 RepID=A0ABR1RKM1_9PEZI